jgi:hypothetical protein
MLASGSVRTLTSMAITRRDASARPDESERTATSRGRRTNVEANARLTGSTAAVLFVLLAAEGLTILRVRSLLTPHVFIGMLLLPPVLLKIGSTSYRFIRYYLGSPAYRRKGPPPPVLRLLGSFVVALTLIVFASGIALLLVRPSLRPTFLLLHRASFVLWFGAMTIHVLGHLADTASLAPRDWMRRTRRDVAGAGLRQWTLVSSVAVGALLGFVLLGQVHPWLTSSAQHKVQRRHSQLPSALPKTNESTSAPTTFSTAPVGTTAPAPGSSSSVPSPTVSIPSPSQPGSTATSAPRATGHGHHHGRKKKPKH